MHHIHTKYIILNDKIFNNLPKDLRLMLAIVSSGHRKSIANEINFYNIELQRSLLKLIALLRVADVLDNKSILGLSLEKNDQKINNINNTFEK